MEDSKLLQLLHSDPDAGMAALTAKYAALVYAVVRGALAGATHLYSSDTEDCVADTLSEFYIGLAGYDPTRCSIKSYLCVLARHNAIDLLRRRDQQRGVASVEDESAVEPVAFDEDMGALAERELREQVLSAVVALGEPDAAILLRKYYFGQSSKQIAAALGMRASNVDTRAHRAIDKLKRMFGGNKI